MNEEISGPLIALCADIVSKRETHATMDSLFTYAGAPGDPPPESKMAKAMEWLRRTNRDDTVEPLKVLGKILENHMEKSLDTESDWDQELLQERKKVRQLLSERGLQYMQGGVIVNALSTPSQTLEQYIAENNIPIINEEFKRAIRSTDTSPREAVSAASNILESVCKVYIEEENLEVPKKQDIMSVWGVVRKDLNIDPSVLSEKYLQKILSGIISIVDGIGSLRTHSSSAHGASKKSYALEPRHSRLAVHSAHTLALFILESWEKKKKNRL